MTPAKDSVLFCQRRGLSRILASRRHMPHRERTNFSAVKGALLAVAVSFGLAGHADAQEAAVTPAVVPPVALYSSVAFVGFDYREQSYYGYAGLIHALNENINTNGFLVRGIVLYGKYDYTLPFVGGGNIDGDIIKFDAMVGYQHFFAHVIGRMYIGLDYENHELSPDNRFDPNRGGEFGLVIRGELDTHYDSLFYGSLLASYTTAKERHWVRGRAGYNFGGIILGPEVIVTGNPASDDTRFGAFAILRNPSLAPVEISFYAGHSNTDTIRGRSSVYAGLELSLAF